MVVKHIVALGNARSPPVNVTHDRGATDTVAMTDNARRVVDLRPGHRRCHGLRIWRHFDSRGSCLHLIARQVDLAAGAVRRQFVHVTGSTHKENGLRDQVVLATKVYGQMGEWPNERGLSAFHIKRACEESLRRMQTDHIDLYQMHHVDRSTPWEEI